MSHLGERVADYLLGEMSAAEKDAAEKHIGQCSVCAEKLEEFRHTYALLQTVSDVEPPRPLVFAAEKRRARPMVWRWLVPTFSAVAASLLTALVLSPAPSETPQSAGVAVPAVIQPAVDVQKILSEFRVSNEQSLAAGLDEQRQQALQRARSEMEYWERQQRAVSRETLTAARTIQLLAQKD